MTATRHNPPAAPRRRAAGFTLVEMLVVVALVVLVIGVSTAGIVATLRANAIDDSVNQVSAALNAARAIAQRDGTDTAVMFFTIQPAGEAPSNAWSHTMDLGLRIVKRNGDAAVGFVDMDDRPIDRLSARIRVRGSTGTANNPTWNAPAVSPNGDLSSVTPAGGATWLAVWFSADGKVQTSDSNGNSSIYYDDPRGTSNTKDAGKDLYATPVGCLVLYDAGDAEGQDTDVSSWINSQTTFKYIRILAFNRYSGTLMNRPK